MWLVHRTIYFRIALAFVGVTLWNILRSCGDMIPPFHRLVSATDCYHSLYLSHLAEQICSLFFNYVSRLDILQPLN